MQERPPGAEVRRITIRDTTILTAVSAVGLVTALRNLPEISQGLVSINAKARFASLGWWTELTQKGGELFQIIHACVLLLYGFFGPLTLALIVVRLFRPRPALRELIFQPGLVARASVCVVA